MPRLPALLDRPVAFGRTDQASDTEAPPETGLEELTRLVDRGATALSGDVWLTADGVPVLDRTGKAGRRLRRRSLDRIAAADLPASATRLDEWYDTIGSAYPLSLDVRDPAAFAPVLDAARAAGEGIEEQLWLCHPDVATLTPWRPETSARLVNVADYRSLAGGLERRAAELEQRDIDGVRLAHADWTGGRITLLHRFGRLALGAGGLYDRELAALLDAGIDGLYSTNIEASAALLAEFYDHR